MISTRNQTTWSKASSSTLIQIVVLFTLWVCKVHGSSLTFELPYGQRKCFMEDIPVSGTVRGTVHVTSGKGDMTLDMFVSDSRGTVHFHKSDVNSIKFSFSTAPTQQHQHYDHDHHHHHHHENYINAEEMERYRFCVVNQVHPQAAAPKDVSRKVTLEISYISHQHAEEVSKLAKSEHAEKLFSTFASVSSDVDGVIRQLDELRSREMELTEMNERTASTILSISVMASIITILTGVLNVMSLKSFFKRKKLA